MLAHVQIRNLALIEDATLDFSPGLNILTGETGAGKSIVVEGLGLLFGWRADSSKVRSGCKEAVVEGCFQLAGPLDLGDTALADAVSGATELVISRRLSADGKSRCFVNGYLTTVANLAELGAVLVDIHGQHEHQSLFKPSVHLELLDRYGGADLVAAREAYRKALRDLRAVESELEKLAALERDKTERAELLRFQVVEIERTKVEPGEDEALERERQVLRNHAKLVAALESAHQALAGVDETPGAMGLVRQAAGDLRPAAELQPELEAAARQLESSVFELEEHGRAIKQHLDDLTFDPQRLAAVEERLFHLGNLKKKYGATLVDVTAYAEKVSEELRALDDSGARLEEYRREQQRLKETVNELGMELRTRRQGAAGGFDRLVEAQLKELAMDEARFKTDFQSLDRPEPSGFDQVAFLISANRGEPLQPLARIASGGEISRVMLALRTVLSGVDGAPIMIFDEIDTGIGGRTAVVVGQKLAELARSRQVICVTHWPQIAAFGDRHFAVTKSDQLDRTVTQVGALSEPDKLAEMARLAGAASGSPAAERHAKDLLKEAGIRKSQVGNHAKRTRRTDKGSEATRAAGSTGKSPAKN